MGHESPVPELPITDCAVTQHQGYGESKHISEQIRQIAAKEFDLRASIMRVGQVAGPVQKGGCWNRAEWFPSLIQTSKALGMIPATLPDVNWIPVDILADIVVDIIHSPDAESPATFSLVNPKPVPWASLVPTVQSWFGTGKVTVVPLHEWITALRSVDMGDANAVKAAPSKKIVDFFEAIARSNAHSPKYTTIMGSAISKTMAELGHVNPGWMYIWLSQWNF
jgi:thioester reductase-like protein